VKRGFHGCPTKWEQTEEEEEEEEEDDEEEEEKEEEFSHSIISSIHHIVADILIKIYLLPVTLMCTGNLEIPSLSLYLFVGYLIMPLPLQNYTE
jgi:hypothetical protein